MKKILLLSIFISTLFSCKKESSLSNDSYLHQLQTSLQDSLSTTDYNALDFDRIVYSKVDSIGLFIARIPFRNQQLPAHFVVAQTDRHGKLQRGKIIKMQSEQQQTSYYGRIEMFSLDLKEKFISGIENGYFTVRHLNPTARITSMSSDLPEVIVVAYVRKKTATPYISVSGLFNEYDSDYSSGSRYFFSLDGMSGGGGSSGSGTSGDGYTSNDPPVLVDIETQDQDNGIDLQKYINCFNAIPDAGATCSIQIFTDIPVDSDPYKMMDFNSRSPGHAFVQIKKSNGSQSAIQMIGFYPKEGYQTGLTNAPIDGKWVDNGLHEFNASLSMQLSPADLKSTLTEILYLRNMRYDIDNYNCTDWALAIFNKTRTDKIEIPLFDIPGNVPSVGTSMPQGLFLKLQQMKASGHSESKNIQIGFQKGWVARSTGPCN